MTETTRVEFALPAYEFRIGGFQAFAIQLPLPLEEGVEQRTGGFQCSRTQVALAPFAAVVAADSHQQTREVGVALKPVTDRPDRAFFHPPNTNFTQNVTEDIALPGSALTRLYVRDAPAAVGLPVDQFERAWHSVAGTSFTQNALAAVPAPPPAVTAAVFHTHVRNAADASVKPVIDQPDRKRTPVSGASSVTQTVRVILDSTKDDPSRATTVLRLIDDLRLKPPADQPDRADHPVVGSASFTQHTGDQIDPPDSAGLRALTLARSAPAATLIPDAVADRGAHTASGAAFTEHVGDSLVAPDAAFTRGLEYRREAPTDALKPVFAAALYAQTTSGATAYAVDLIEPLALPTSAATRAVVGLRDAPSTIAAPDGTATRGLTEGRDAPSSIAIPVGGATRAFTGARSPAAESITEPDGTATRLDTASRDVPGASPAPAAPADSEDRVFAGGRDAPSATTVPSSAATTAVAYSRSPTAESIAAPDGVAVRTLTEGRDAPSSIAIPVDGEGRAFSGSRDAPSSIAIPTSAATRSTAKSRGVGEAIVAPDSAATRGATILRDAPSTLVAPADQPDRDWFVSPAGPTSFTRHTGERVAPPAIVPAAPTRPYVYAEVPVQDALVALVAPVSFIIATTQPQQIVLATVVVGVSFPSSTTVIQSGLTANATVPGTTVTGTPGTWDPSRVLVGMTFRLSPSAGPTGVITKVAPDGSYLTLSGDGVGAAVDQPWDVVNGPTVVYDGHKGGYQPGFAGTATVVSSALESGYRFDFHRNTPWGEPVASPAPPGGGPTIGHGSGGGSVGAPPAFLPALLLALGAGKAGPGDSEGGGMSDAADSGGGSVGSAAGSGTAPTYAVARPNGALFQPSTFGLAAVPRSTAAAWSGLPGSAGVVASAGGVLALSGRLFQGFSPIGAVPLTTIGVTVNGQNNAALGVRPPASWSFKVGGGVTLPAVWPSAVENDGGYMLQLLADGTLPTGDYNVFIESTALLGAGIRVPCYSGAPGSGATVRIRALAGWFATPPSAPGTYDLVVKRIDTGAEVIIAGAVTLVKHSFRSGVLGIRALWPPGHRIGPRSTRAAGGPQ